MRVCASYKVNNGQEVKMAKVRNYARMRKFEAGEVMRVNIYPVRPVAKGRNSKRKPSRACQEALNRRNSLHRYNDIIHLNFNKKTGGYRVLLDYNFFIDEFGRNPNEEERKLYFAAYIRKLRNLYRAHGGELVWVAPEAHVGKKCGKAHHHFFISYPPADVSRDELNAAWEFGYSNYSALRFRNGSIAGLATYFLNGTPNRKWSCSRNCKRPSEEVYEDGSPASVSIVDDEITMQQAHYLDKHRKDFAYIEKLFPGYAVNDVRPKNEAVGVSGTEYNLLPFDGPFVEIELYKLTAVDKRVKLRTPRGRVKPGVKA